MLIQFTFKNYKSFKDETTLDLSAAKMTEFAERVVSIGNERILPVTAIYGANASGKSNVYSAFEYMSHYVLESFRFGDDPEMFEEERPRPFLFDIETEKEDTMFEVYFTVPNDPMERIYHYGFCVGTEGVTEEWLNYKAKTARKFAKVFYRDHDSLDLSGISRENRDNIKIALEKQVLIVSLGAKLRVDKCKMVRDWFLNNEFADFGNVINNFCMAGVLPKGFTKDQKVRDHVVDFLSSFDEHIQGFEVRKIQMKDDPSEEVYQIDSLHQKKGSDEPARIALSEESAGTLKMFSLYPELQRVMKNGGVFFVDELNARLHPLLVRNFVLTFADPLVNVNHAQLIFTTHDTWQLSNRLLRRDEIWFTEKDENGASTMYSLADFVDEDGIRIRKDESYEKNYLVGKYGAIPSLKRLSLFVEN